MSKLIVSRWIFDTVIGDHRELATMPEFYMDAQDAMEIRKLPEVGEGVETLYMDFGGDLSSARAFSDMYGIPRDRIILARDHRKLEGRRARIKPVNLDYDWSFLNWNHEIHHRARQAIYDAEARYGSV